MTDQPQRRGGSPLLEAALGVEFINQELLRLALTHKSYSVDKLGTTGSTIQTDNERLEFLGDAVLDLAMSAHLMARFPDDSEGVLSKKRASLVNEDTLAQIAHELKLDTYILLGKGEAKTGGLQKPRILASALEAILGACYQDRGYETVSELVLRLFMARLEEVGQSSVHFRQDYKTRLQERAQEIQKETPIYQVENEVGPDHEKLFEVSVRLSGNVLATGTGKSKKSAEQEAARKALEQIG